MIGHTRRIRQHNLARPLLNRDDRNHAEGLIDRATTAAVTARDVAAHNGLDGAAERIAWALDFLADAAEQVRARC